MGWSAAQVSASSRRLLLTGPMGSGKSTVGRRLATWLGAEFQDLDELITTAEGATIPELFARGEGEFRQSEARAARAWLEAARPAPQVLALGGGTLSNEAVADALAAEPGLVHLDAPAEELLARLDAPGRQARPLIAGQPDPVGRLAALREDRAAGYARAAVRIDTAGEDATSVAVAVMRALYAPDGGAWAEPPSPLAGPAREDGVVSASRGCLDFAPCSRAALLWDSNLPRVHREALVPRLRELAGGELTVLEREGGEGCKTPESLVGGWRELLHAGIDKDVPLWIVGGGTVSDLGGMLAHTFKRGLPCAILPTTLLAQVDAGLGGKNGINLDAAKNAVGTIRLPDRVALDSLFLLTLADEDLRCGLSEAIKSGVIADQDLVELIEREPDALRNRSLPHLEELTCRAAAVKLGIVAGDLHESGRRRLLNFGHTLGHAIEALALRRSSVMAHGDAVAIGMIFAARLAARTGELQEKGFIERLESLLAAVDLPTGLPEEISAGRDLLLGELKHDKKRRGGANVWVLPRRFGDLVTKTVPDDEVAAVLESW